MQIALVYIGHDDILLEYTKMFSASLSEKGHIPTLVNGILERPTMGFFRYIVFFLESPRLFGRNYLKELNTFFKESSKINSRFCSIFTNKTFLSDKYLLKYMQKVENEGLVLHQSDIITNSEYAKNILNSFTPIKNGD